MLNPLNESPCAGESIPVSSPESVKALPLPEVPIDTLSEFTVKVFVISEFLIVAAAEIVVSVSIFTSFKVAAAEMVREVSKVT